mmetsp:Transcript_2826/g.7688  ORF Transcript_2826/g.7688 Transcript_2826/m.7688 type:complete len:383 (-) Transcript_2826:958-2106(-)
MPWSSEWCLFLPFITLFRRLASLGRTPISVLFGFTTGSTARSSSGRTPSGGTVSPGDLSLSEFLPSLDLAAGTRSVLIVETVAEEGGDLHPCIPFGHFPPSIVFKLHKPRCGVVVSGHVADDPRNDRDLLAPFPVGVFRETVHDDALQFQIPIVGLGNVPFPQNDRVGLRHKVLGEPPLVVRQFSVALHRIVQSSAARAVAVHVAGAVSSVKEHVHVDIALEVRLALADQQAVGRGEGADGIGRWLLRTRRLVLVRVEELVGRKKGGHVSPVVGLGGRGGETGRQTRQAGGGIHVPLVDFFSDCALGHQAAALVKVDGCGVRVRVAIVEVRHDPAQGRGACPNAGGFQFQFFPFRVVFAAASLESPQGGSSARCGNGRPARG